jgi:phage tail-like protein
MPPVLRDDPYTAYNFEVTVDGVSDDGQAVKGSFTEAIIGDTTIDPIEYRNGSEGLAMRKSPGIPKFGNLTFKRGSTGHLEFWNWIVESMNGLVRRTSVSVIMLNENRDPVMQWNFRRCWITKFTGPSFNAKNNEIAIESIEICHEGVEIDGQA